MAADPPCQDISVLDNAPNYIGSWVHYPKEKFSGVFAFSRGLCGKHFLECGAPLSLKFLV